VVAVPERVLVAEHFHGAVEDAADVERVSGEGIEGFHGGGHRWVGWVFDVVDVEGDERHGVRGRAGAATTIDDDDDDDDVGGDRDRGWVYKSPKNR